MEVAKGNWVGYRTLFYNKETQRYSEDIHQVIDYANLEIDPEGLAAYLDYGYSVFGRTPVKDVQYLLPDQSLHLVEEKIEVVQTADQTIDLLGIPSTEDDVLERLQAAVNSWAEGFSEDILIPTSGGFDSRLMNVLLRDKSRIHAYTYGTSSNQQASRESVYAQLLSQRLGTQWKRIPLGVFNVYIQQWYDQFGPAVAASGTYHIEFYNKIQVREQGNPMRLLSGIIGDAWAGAVQVPKILDLSGYSALGHTHGMTADARRATKTDYRSLIEPLFDRQKDALKSPEYRIITAMRTKMMMLQYLITVPERMGYPGYSPFLEESIALSMLNLPKERRTNRLWQQDYFRRKNLLFEEEKHPYTYQNSLNFSALTNERLEPLNIAVLRAYMEVPYLEWINRKIQHIGRKERLFQHLMHTPKVKGVLQLLGAKNTLMEAYFAYITIKPIEKLLMKRNAYSQNT